MHRRETLKLVAAGILATPLIDPVVFAAGEKSRRVHLSKNGSGRASAYAEAVKTISVGAKTHVTWLDSVDKSFLVRIQTLDRKSGQWSIATTIGKAHDNHGGPSLTVDSKGYLHVIYFPHHHPFRYRRSLKPNDATRWTPEVQIGQKLTYPTLLCGHDDTLYLTGRRSYDGKPWSIELWKKPSTGNWQSAGVLVRSASPGYSHFQEAMCWGPDHKRLHLSCRIHEKGGAVETVGYLRSDDEGKTWQRLDGTTVELPVSSKTIDRIVSGGRVAGKQSHKCGSIAVSPQNIPHILYSSAGEMSIARPDKKKGWTNRPLSRIVDRIWPNCSIGPSAQITFNNDGHLFVTACITHDNRYDVVRLMSKDEGESFVGHKVSQGINRERQWWPNLERPTGFNRVSGIPGILFTAGIKGAGNKDILSNDVYWSNE